MFEKAGEASEPLKIALNGRFLTRPMSGVDRVANELFRAMLLDAESSKHMRIMLPKTDQPVDASFGVTHDALGIAHAKRLTGHLWEQFELPRMVGREEWLLNFCSTGPLSRSRQAIMIHDAQFITQTESYSWRFRAFYQALVPRLAKKANILLTVSHFARRELEGFGVFPKDKAIVVYNGCDHMLRITQDDGTLARKGLTPGRYFMVLGNLAPHKNLNMIVAAYNQIGTSLPLVVAGGGKPGVFKDVGIEDTPKVRVLGRIEDAELKALMSNAKALLFPSKTEGFGLPPLEAMICGCPVIATTGGAVPEVCGDAPLYADPNKPSEWVDAINHMLDDPEVGQQMRARGERRVRNYTWSAAARTLTDALSRAGASAT